MLGRMLKSSERCDYCHVPRGRIILVTEGPCIGKFCSQIHYDLARKAIEEQKVPKHELPDEEKNNGQ